MATLAVLVSLAPNLLPRSAPAQAALTALLVALALATLAVTRHLFGVRDDRIGRSPWRVHLRPAVLVCVPGLIAGAMWHAGRWQNELRAAMDMAPVGPWYWTQWAALTLAPLACGVVIARAAGRAARALGRTRAAAVAVTALTATALLATPAVVDERRAAYAAANAGVDSALVPPAYVGAGARWETLGAQGRRFVTDEPAGPLRIYIGLDSAPTTAARVALAIEELERTGGFDRGHLVIAVPTGSGWVDAAATSGFADRFHDDVAVVALQYSYAPSWATFLFGRDAALTSARALFEAVERRVLELPTAARPRLYVYGQSLGALAGAAIFADEADRARRTCAVLWAGPPVGTAATGSERVTVLANSSDPVVSWSAALLWRAPDRAAVRRDAPVPRWIPLVSFVQTTADLLSALDAPRGHGHRYGTDQGSALGDCPILARR